MSGRARTGPRPGQGKTGATYTADPPGHRLVLEPKTSACLEPVAEVYVDRVNHRVEIGCVACGRPRTILDAADLRALAQARRTR